MSVAEFLAELRRRDIRVWIDGERLRCNAGVGALTPEVRGSIGRQKHDIIAFLRGAQALARQPRAIVPMQEGVASRVPVFAVAGHNGDVFAYRSLARRLGADQPFYGLQPPGLDGGSEPLSRVEDLAAYFAAQIRGVLPAGGPCIIAGFCAGGAIAFELARQLQQSGTEVRFVAMFGAPFPRFFRPEWQIKWRALHKIDRIRARIRSIAGRASDDGDAAGGALAGPAPATPDPASSPILAWRGKVEEATLKAVRHYTPGTFPGRLVHFLPSARWARGGFSAASWKGVVRQAIEYCGPAGSTGDNMLREPRVAEFAGLFRRCCDDERPVG